MHRIWVKLLAQPARAPHAGRLLGHKGERGALHARHQAPPREHQGACPCQHPPHCARSRGAFKCLCVRGASFSFVADQASCMRRTVHSAQCTVRRKQDACSATKENEAPCTRASKRRRVSTKVPVPASTLHTAALNDCSRRALQGCALPCSGCQLWRSLRRPRRSAAPRRGASDGLNREVVDAILRASVVAQAFCQIALLPDRPLPAPQFSAEVERRQDSRPSGCGAGLRAASQALATPRSLGSC